MREELILMGGGGHGESIIDTIRGKGEYSIAGILDPWKKVGTEVLGVKVIGSDQDLAACFNRGIRNAVIAVGSMGNPGPRRKLYQLCKNIGYEFPNIIDKSSSLSETLKMGEGNFIGKGVLINSGVTIENGTIINTGAVLGAWLPDRRLCPHSSRKRFMWKCMGESQCPYWSPFHHYTRALPLEMTP